MIRESFAYESGEYFARAVPKGYDIFKHGTTAAARVAHIGYRGPDGLRRVRAEIARRERADRERSGAWVHLTLTGYAAGTPFCDSGMDKEAARANGATFAHVPYSNAAAFLARPDICPACKAEWDAAGDGDA